MSILAWVIFGALAGWVATAVAGTKGRQGCLFNVIIGIAGAFVGGFIMDFLTGHQMNFAFNLPSFFVAVLGAVVLLLLTGYARKK